MDEIGVVPDTLQEGKGVIGLLEGVWSDGLDRTGEGIFEGPDGPAHLDLSKEGELETLVERDKRMVDTEDASSLRGTDGVDGRHELSGEGV